MATQKQLIAKAIKNHGVTGLEGLNLSDVVKYLYENDTGYHFHASDGWLGFNCGLGFHTVYRKVGKGRTAKLELVELMGENSVYKYILGEIKPI